MRSMTCVLLAALLCWPGQGSGQTPSHDTWVELSQGNIDLGVLDGTNISLAPDTHIAIDPAEAPGDITHIKVHKGQLHVSNALHKHSDALHIEVGEHTFVLNRGSALVGHTSDGRHVTLLHGQSLGLLGGGAPATEPGTRLTPDANGVRQHRPDPASVRRMLDQTGGPGSTGQRSTLSPERGSPLLPAPPGQGGTGRGTAPKTPGQIMQREAFRALIEEKQGGNLAPPPPGAKPPPAVRPPPPPPPPRNRPGPAKIKTPPPAAGRN